MLLMRQFKPFQSFHTEDDKNLWLKRRDVFSQALPFLTRRERSVAVLVFDADRTGIMVKPTILARLLGVSPSYISDITENIDFKCLRLLHAGDI